MRAQIHVINCDVHVANTQKCLQNLAALHFLMNRSEAPLTYIKPPKIFVHHLKQLLTSKGKYFPPELLIELPK